MIQDAVVQVSDVSDNDFSTGLLNCRDASCHRGFNHTFDILCWGWRCTFDGGISAGWESVVFLFHLGLEAMLISGENKIKNTLIVWHIKVEDMLWANNYMIGAREVSSLRLLPTELVRML